MEDSNQFDGIFMTVLQQKHSISGFFESVFGFLRRQSDFFTDQKKAEEVMVGECKKQYDQWTKDKQKKDQEEKMKKEKEELKRKQKEMQKPQEQAQPQEVKQQQPQTQVVPKVMEEEPTNNDGEKKDKDDEKAPVGNGGKTDKYIWTQTLEEVQIYVPIPEGIRAKNLSVKIETDKILVQIIGQTPLLLGEFYEKIHQDESVWTITDGQIQDYKGRYIHISIEKWKNQMHWWDCVIKGDVKINTQKINPEPSKLDELEGETKSTVEKMMFDMRQKQMGKPTSDELQKREKLDEFMKSHPEMDFSKCKFN